MSEPEAVWAVACDDIREEASGKLIAIGMYSESYLPVQLPLIQPICFLIWLKALTLGTFKLTFNVYIEPREERCGRFSFNYIVNNATNSASAPTPSILLKIEGPGALVLRQVMQDGVEKEVMRLPIIFSDDPNASPPPS